MPPDVVPTIDPTGGTPTPVEPVANPTPQPAVVESDAQPGDVDGNVAQPTTPVVDDANKPRPWYQERIDQLTRNWRSTERADAEKAQRVAQLERTLADIQAGGRQPDGTPRPAPASRVPTQDEINQHIRDQASVLAAEQSFARECNAVADKGKSEFKDFDQAIANFNNLGGLNPEFIASVLVTDAPHKVLHALSGDLDEAARIMNLPPIQRTAALVKFESKISGQKLVSSAPAPIGIKVGGNGRAELPLDDPNVSMDEFVRRRARDLAAKQA